MNSARPPRLRRIGAMPSIRRANLGARVPTLASELERGNAERAQLYASPRWRAARRVFLKLHPVCSTAGCGARTVVVDHVHGHQRERWRERFWDQSGWAALCLSCHGAKSRDELTAWRRAGETGVGKR